MAASETHHVVAIAHRGEHLHHPENTMPAFEEAIRLGADFIEVDVQTTADGKLVLTGSRSGEAILWDGKSGNRIRQFQSPAQR